MQAISGATVTTSPGGYTATTDANGSYTLSNVPVGTYSLTAAKAGYQSHTWWNLVVTNGQTNTLKLTVNRLRGHTNQLTLEPHGLPETVRATPLDLPEKGGETTLSFSATDDTPSTKRALPPLGA